MKRTANQSKSLRIVIVVTYTYPYVGSGIGNVAQAQAERLAVRGHKVTLISSNIPRTKQTFFHNHVKYFKLSAIDILEKLHIPIPLFFFNSDVIKEIRKADLIHVHDSLYPSSLLATIIGKIFKKKIILTQHIPYVQYPNPIINFIEKVANHTVGQLTLSLSDKIIVINSSLYKSLKNHYGKVYFIPNGVDTSFFHPVNTSTKRILRKKYNIPNNTKVILFVGRLVPKKGLNIILNSTSNEYYTVVVGKGKDITNTNTTANLIFLGEKSPDELKEIYQLSDLFALPSNGEGFPLSIQEAMSSGLPVITSINNYDHKFVNNDFVSFINLKQANLTIEIKKILKNRIQFNYMSKESRRFAVKNFSWDKNINTLEQLYLLKETK